MSILDAGRGSKQPEQYRINSEVMTMGLGVRLQSQGLRSSEAFPAFPSSQADRDCRTPTACQQQSQVAWPGASSSSSET